jgi:hypothetical protein
VVGGRVKTQTPIGLADQVEAEEKIRATNRKRRFNAIPVTQNSTWHESRWKRMRTMEVRAGFGKAQNSRVWSAIVRKALVAFKP